MEPIELKGDSSLSKKANFSLLLDEAAQIAGNNGLTEEILNALLNDEIQ